MSIPSQTVFQHPARHLPISTAKRSILHTVSGIAVPFDATAALIVTSMFKNGALNPEPAGRVS